MGCLPRASEEKGKRCLFMFHNSKLSRSFWNFSWNIMSSNILCWLPCVNTKGKSPATTKGLRALPKVPFSVLPPYLRWPQCTCRSQAVCTAAVRDTQVMLTLIRLWRKTGKVLLKPKQNMCGKSSTSWLAHPKGGLAGGWEPQWPRGSGFPAKSLNADRSPCFIHWVMFSF